MVLLISSRNIPSEHDDSSISSTITVDMLDNKVEQGGNASDITLRSVSSHPKKRVRFNAQNTFDYTLEQTSKDEIRERWYNAAEYREFKRLAQDSSQQIIRIEARNRAPYSYKRVMENTFQACLQASTDNSNHVLPDSEIIHLQRWLEVASSRCGLEKWSVRTVTKDRSSRRQTIAATVKHMQNTLKNFHGLSEEEKPELIRLSCEKISRPSRLYSSILGSALAAAVQKENRNDMKNQ